ATAALLPLRRRRALPARRGKKWQRQPFSRFAGEGLYPPDVARNGNDSPSPASQEKGSTRPTWQEMATAAFLPLRSRRAGPRPTRQDMAEATLLPLRRSMAGTASQEGRGA